MYRLITHKTYEEQLFETASRKYGLEEAILGTRNREGDEGGQDGEMGGVGAGGGAHPGQGRGGKAKDGNPETSSKEIERLLRQGAYDLLKVLLASSSPPSLPTLSPPKPHSARHLNRAATMCPVENTVVETCAGVVLVQDEDESARFSTENIDQILQQRTQTRSIGGYARACPPRSPTVLTCSPYHSQTSSA